MEAHHKLSYFVVGLLVLGLGAMIFISVRQNNHNPVTGGLTTSKTEQGQLVKTPYYSFTVANPVPEGLNANIAIKHENYDVVVDADDDTLSKSHTLMLLSLVSSKRAARSWLKDKQGYCLGMLTHDGEYDYNYYLMFNYGRDLSPQERAIVDAVIPTIVPVNEGDSGKNTFARHENWADGTLE